jgi:hypothetical protein
VTYPSVYPSVLGARNLQFTQNLPLISRKKTRSIAVRIATQQVAKNTAVHVNETVKKKTGETPFFLKPSFLNVSNKN